MLVYCDGACKKNPGPGGWGVSTRDDDNNLQYAYGYIEESTNNIAEMTAMINALRFVQSGGEQNNTIKSDSQYVINGLTKWIPGWVKKGWKTGAGEPVKNKELWVEMRDIYTSIKDEGRSVEILWVKGHSGEPGNELVDQLANLAIELKQDSSGTLQKHNNEDE